MAKGRGRFFEEGLRHPNRLATRGENMMVFGQWVLFSLVFIILFFFIWYTARFICTMIFMVVSLLVVAYVLNQMSMLPAPLNTYADVLFRKQTCEVIKAKVRDWLGPCTEPVEEGIEKSARKEGTGKNS
jgi:hypothetical protein